MIKLKLRKLEHAADLPFPSYETPQSAGMDVRAALIQPELILHPGERYLIPTGIQAQIPIGYELQVRPRSGLAIKHGITMLNSPGTIDADYRGEIKVIAINHGSLPYTVRHGDRIAQLIMAPVQQAVIVESEDLDRTDRGDGGFGSTGR
ncbi:MAG: dUTP diphosphatase [Balneolales bacterium]|nr:dUTP diphosphatase [Balneolales bacterium]